MAIEQILSEWKLILAIAGFPAWLLVIMANDMIRLKLHLMLRKKKGAKLVVDITTDKNIKITAKTPENNKVFKIGEKEVTIIPSSLYYAPQFGVQAALITQSGKNIFDPYKDQKIDPIDGELYDLAIKKAKQLGALGGGWGDSKEQKLIMLAIAGIAIIAIMVFFDMSQVTQLQTYLQSAIPGIQQSITNLATTKTL